jgi:YVTN family beta-propeller protein
MKLAQVLVFAVLVAITLSGTLSGHAAEYVYLENTDSGDISVVDIPGHNVVSTIKVGQYLDDVVGSHDGKIVYTNRTESLGLPGSHAGESSEIVAISTETEQILWRLPINGWAHHLTLTKDDRWLFVPLFDRVWLEVVDTQQHKVVKRVPLGYGGHGTRLSPDGRRLYVGSMFLDVLTVVDVDTLRPVKLLPFGDAVRPFTFTRDEKTLFVQLSRLHGFKIVDLTGNAAIREVALPKLGSDVELPQFYPHTYNHGIELSPDEKLLLAAGSAAGYVCAYRLPDLELLAKIPVGEEPNWIVFSKDGAYAYVSNRKSDTLSVISVRDLKQIKQIPVGKYPQRMRVVDVPVRSRAAKP